MLAVLALLALQADGTLPAGGNVAAGASMALMECLEMRDAQPTRAAFTAEVRQVGKRMAADPTFSGLVLDDAGGRGCRVSFIGTTAQADQIAAAGAKNLPGQLEVSRSPAPNGALTIAATIIDPRPR